MKTDKNGNIIYAYEYNEESGQFHDNHGLNIEGTFGWQTICYSIDPIYVPFYNALHRIFDFECKNGKPKEGLLPKPSVEILRLLWRAYLPLRDEIPEWDRLDASKLEERTKKRL